MPISTEKKKSGMLGLGAGEIVSCSVQRPYFEVFALLVGDEGSAVEALQTDLNALGFNAGPIDGKYGPKTQAGVEAFQEDANIVVDGVVGPQTLNALCGYLTEGSSGGRHTPGGDFMGRLNNPNLLLGGVVVVAAGLTIYAGMKDKK